MQQDIASAPLTARWCAGRRPTARRGLGASSSSSAPSPRAACPCKQRRRDVLREATRRERCQCSVKRSARRLLRPAERIGAHWSRAAGQDCVLCARSRRAVVGVAAGHVSGAEEDHACFCGYVGKQVVILTEERKVFVTPGVTGGRVPIPYGSSLTGAMYWAVYLLLLRTVASCRYKIVNRCQSRPETLRTRAGCACGPGASHERNG